MADGVVAPIDFEARFTKAVENLEDFMGRVEKRTQSGAQSMKFLENAAKAFVAAFSIRKIIDGLETMVDKASEAEEATYRMTQALKATGSATDNNIRRFQDLAKELEKTSKFEDDLILSQVAVAKQFGVTNREAEQLIRTAVDLASVTGEDLTTTVRQLGQTLDGTAGRMSQQFPILQQLTAAQLRHGAAIKTLGDQYRGAASRALDTFKGQQSQLSNAVGNLIEALGTLIIRNPEVILAMKSLVGGINAVTEAIEKSATIFGRFTSALKPYVSLVYDLLTANTNAFSNFINYNNKLADGVDLFGGKMNNLVGKFNAVTGKFESLSNNADDASKNMRSAGQSFDYVTGKFSKGFDESKLQFDRFANETKEKFETLQKQLEDIGRTELDTLTNLYNKNRQLINKAADQGFIKRQEQTELLAKLELKYIREAGEQRRKQYQELESKVRDAYDNPFRTLFGNQYGTGRISPEAQSETAGALGIGRETLRGEEGARNVISSTIAGIASIWLGPLGKIIGELVSELSRGPAYVRKMMTEFFDAIPDLVVNLIAAVQEAVLVFADKAPEALEKLIERAPEIIDTLIKNLPKLIAAVPRYAGAIVVAITRGIFKAFEGIGKVLGRYINDIVKGAGRFINELIKGAGRFIGELVKGIQKAFTKGIGGGVFGGSGGGGAIGAVVGGAGGALTGAVASISRGFKFKGGASDQGTSQPIQVVMQISNKQLATAIIDLQKLGFT